ncbi:MAG: hypothetical protein IJ113_00515 [Eggerthellaceae bacterium]|nr:hypothetical protein [Eggerthellaceae bacterium]
MIKSGPETFVSGPTIGVHFTCSPVTFFVHPCPLFRELEDAIRKDERKTRPLFTQRRVTEGQVLRHLFADDIGMQKHEMQEILGDVTAKMPAALEQAVGLMPKQGQKQLELIAEDMKPRLHLLAS